MDFILLSIIVFISFLQSIFGVGILLFGTPILLFLDYNFVHTLNILLPLSLIVNLVQLYSGFKEINYKFYFSFLKIAIPFVFISLYFVVNIEFNMNFIIGLFIFFVFIQSRIPYFKESFIKKINEKLILVLLGIVHGLSNLGGSLLTTIVYSKNISKDETRSTIAICYATFALIQLLTLLLLNQYYYDNIFFYSLVSFTTVILSERFLYKRISSESYKLFFEIFLLIMGLFLMFK